MIGGVVGLLLSLVGLAWMNNLMKLLSARSNFFRLDLEMAGLAILLSLVAGLIAGLYPAWRVCRIPPAIHLKVQ